MPQAHETTENKSACLYESHLKNLTLLSRGKVRDIYAIDDEHLLIVTSDRLSAFDVVLPDPIPGKGGVLTALSDFWLQQTRSIIANHATSRCLEEIIDDPDEMALIRDRACIVRRLTPLPIEAIVRGYLIGSGWNDYQKDAAVCGITLPKGLRQAEKLPEPLFTPSSKSSGDEHDENIDFTAMIRLVGQDTAEHVRDVSLALYQQAASFARERGIIIADTKFEFGLTPQGNIVLIDEVLTPDSSRFWPADQYRLGNSPPSFDKQFVRDYLETLDWNKRAPAPALSLEIIQKTAEKYQEAKRILLARRSGQ